jgi:glutathione S-transferase
VSASAAGAPDPLPVLWHLKVSNFNEKARWALDHKGIPHVRRAVHPGQHRKVARGLWGGTTFPVLVLDGTAIGDSTAIIAALERQRPEPPLYPADPVERARALDLEEFFDEQLGPYSRLLVLHHLLEEPAVMLDAFVPDLARSRRLVARATFGRVRRQVRAQLGIHDAAVEQAFEKLRLVGRRFQAELGSGRHLVGDRFTVADLTLAALVAPVVAPEQFPYPQPQRGHPVLEPVRDALAQYGIVDWTLAMYAWHRGNSSEACVRPGLTGTAKP